MAKQEKDAIPEPYDKEENIVTFDPFKLSTSPEYEDSVPKIPDSVYEEIIQDIREHGQHVPIIINRNAEILDGHTRARICKDLGRQVRTQLCPLKYEDPLFAKKFIIEVNRNRRHLTDFQRIQLQHKLDDTESALAKKRQLSTLPKKGQKGFQPVPVQNYNHFTADNTQSEPQKKKGRVIDLSAAKAQVSPMTYHKGVWIIKQSPSPETLQRLENGTIKIDKVYKKLQREKKKAELIAEPRLSLPQGCKLILGDCRLKDKEILDSSVAMIFTDPLYNQKALPLYGWLGRFALRVLKPGCSLMAIVPHYALPQIFDLMRDSMTEGLKYKHQHAIFHKGAAAIQPVSQVFVGWKPILEFIKGGVKLRTPDFIMRDCVVVSHPPDKSLLWLAQSPIEAAHFISKRTVEGDIVVDPFLGSAAYGVAALNLKRQFIGIEIDRATYNIAEDNIRKLSSAVPSSNTKNTEAENI